MKWGKSEELIHCTSIWAMKNLEKNKKEQKNNVMNIDEILNNKQVVNEEKYEDGNNAQKTGASIIMRIMKELNQEQPEELVLDFFFYTDERSKAESLAGQLQKYGYQVTIDEKGKTDLKFSIIGQTIPLSNDDDVVEKWATKMNELGYIHDCEFDGWGTPMMNGGWVGR